MTKRRYIRHHSEKSNHLPQKENKIKIEKQRLFLPITKAFDYCLVRGALSASNGQHKAANISNIYIHSERDGMPLGATQMF